MNVATRPNVCIVNYWNNLLAKPNYKNLKTQNIQNQHDRVIHRSKILQGARKNILLGVIKVEIRLQSPKTELRPQKIEKKIPRYKVKNKALQNLLFATFKLKICIVLYNTKMT
jgi:hypothetical protein